MVNLELFCGLSYVYKESCMLLKKYYFSIVSAASFLIMYVILIDVGLPFCCTKTKNTFLITQFY